MTKLKLTDLLDPTVSSKDDGFTMTWTADSDTVARWNKQREFMERWMAYVKQPEKTAMIPAFEHRGIRADKPSQVFILDTMGCEVQVPGQPNDSPKTMGNEDLSAGIGEVSPSRSKLTSKRAASSERHKPSTLLLSLMKNMQPTDQEPTTNLDY